MDVGLWGFDSTDRDRHHTPFYYTVKLHRNIEEADMPFFLVM